MKEFNFDKRKIWEIPFASKVKISKKKLEELDF